MTDEQYSMTFFEWCNAAHCTGLILNEYGDVDYRNPLRKTVTEQYHDLWKAELKEYRLRNNSMIFLCLDCMREFLKSLRFDVFGQ